MFRVDMLELFNYHRNVITNKYVKILSVNNTLLNIILTFVESNSNAVILKRKNR